MTAYHVWVLSPRTLARVGGGYGEATRERIRNWRKKLRLSRDIRVGEKAAIEPFVTGNVVDVGCGARKTFRGSIGIDRYGYGERIVEYGRRVSVANHKSSASSLPFKDETMDTVIASHVLEHIGDTREALSEWLRILKPGGHLCLLIPDARWTAGRDPTHVHEWTSEDFRREWADRYHTVQFDTLHNYWSFDWVVEKQR
ncbi:MAG: class I SAM-dependent methyltransferase [Chloroflexi bacterium]|nr:class I SAM-dependent methyltransferase [Chloroflexota bacterium]